MTLLPGGMVLDVDAYVEKYQANGMNYELYNPGTGAWTSVGNTPEQYWDSAANCGGLDFLRNRFGAKTYVAGFSFGATIGAYAAAQRPDLVATLVAVGMDIDGAAAGAGAYDFAVAAARQRGNRRATRQLEAIGPPAPDLQTVHHPGPLGHQLRRSHDQRNLRQPGARTARQPGPLNRLFGRRRHPDHPRYHRDTGRAAAELAAMDLARTLPASTCPSSWCRAAMTR